MVRMVKTGNDIQIEMLENKANQNIHIASIHNQIDILLERSVNLEFARLESKIIDASDCSIIPLSTPQRWQTSFRGPTPWMKYSRG